MTAAATYTIEQALAEYGAGASLRTVAERLGLPAGTARGRLVAAAGGIERYAALVAARPGQDKVIQLPANTFEPTSWRPASPEQTISRTQRLPEPATWGPATRIDALQPGQRFRAPWRPAGEDVGTLEDISAGGATVTVRRPRAEPRTATLRRADDTEVTVTFPTSSTERIRWSRGTIVEPEIA